MLQKSRFLPALTSERTLTMLKAFACGRPSTGSDTNKVGSSRRPNKMIALEKLAREQPSERAPTVEERHAKRALILSGSYKAVANGNNKWSQEEEL